MTNLKIKKKKTVSCKLEILLKLYRDFLNGKNCVFRITNRLCTISSSIKWGTSLIKIFPNGCTKEIEQCYSHHARETFKMDRSVGETGLLWVAVIGVPEFVAAAEPLDDVDDWCCCCVVMTPTLIFCPVSLDSW